MHVKDAIGNEVNVTL